MGILRKSEVGSKVLIKVVSVNVFRKVLNLVIITFFLGCSALTISTVQEGELVIGEGRYNELSWDEDLVFERISWYYELTLLYDFLLAEIPVHSNYRRWLSSSESITANGCAKFYIAGVYASRDSRVSQNDIWKQFDTNKLKFTNVNGFYRNLSFSERFITNSFNLYKFWGICIRDSGEPVRVRLSFPGYSSKELSL